MVYLRYFETKQDALNAEDLVAPLSCFVLEGKESLTSSSEFAVDTPLRIRKNSSGILEIIPYNLTISYTSVYGEVPASKKVSYEYALTSNDLLPIEEPTEQEFIGWYIGDTKIEPGYIVKTNITLVAKFNALTQYNITYTSDYDQENIPPLKTVLSGYTLVESDLPSLSDPGHTFNGWSKSVGYRVTSDTNIVASWSILRCKINYENTKNPGDAPQTKIVDYGYYIQQEDIPEKDPIGAFDFLGWACNGELVSVGYRIKTDPTVLKTVWNEVKYNLTYNTAGHGLQPMGKEVPRGYVLTSDDLPEITDPGYTFLGWYIGETKAVAGETTITRATELFAHWSSAV